MTIMMMMMMMILTDGRPMVDLVASMPGLVQMDQGTSWGMMMMKMMMMIMMTMMLTDGQPMVDLVASMPGVVQGGPGGMLREVELSEEEAHAIAFTPLSVLLQQALTAPLSAQ